MTEDTTKAVQSLMDFDLKFHRCPLFEMCKSPSKKKEGWACVQPMIERLQMCTSFYALAVAMNNGRSPYDNS